MKILSNTRPEESSGLWKHCPTTEFKLAIFKLKLNILKPVVYALFRVRKV